MPVVIAQETKQEKKTVKTELGGRVVRSTNRAEMLLSYDRIRKDHFSVFVLGKKVKLGQS